MERVRPVLSPFSIRWREFCQRMLPWVVFSVVSCAVALLWARQPARSALVGRAEAIHYTVSAPRAGLVAIFGPDLLQQVKKGEVLARILPYDLNAVAARLNASLDLLRVQLVQNADRNVINYQQFRLEWMRNNVELSSAKIELQFADSNFERAYTLFKASNLPEAELELQRSRRDSLRNRVEALSKINADLESEIEQLRPSSADKSVPPESPYDRAITAVMRAQSEELKAIEESCTLLAPTDGVVASLNKHTGENVAAGEALLILGSLKSSRIVGFVRQPMGVHLQSGDWIEVGLRNPRHAVFKSRILSVGTQLELIDAALLPFSQNRRTEESGLPFLVEVPEGITVLPGESLNLRWIGKSR